MSLPGDRLSTVSATAKLRAPDDLGRPTRTIDYELGGIEISDTSQGLQAQQWRLRLDGTAVKIGKYPNGTETTIFSEAGITQLTLAFDQNGAATVGYMAFGIPKLRWFDSSIGGIATTVLTAGAASLFLTLDDKRDGQAAQSDMLLFYIRGNRLCYTQQRDRFLIERTLRWLAGPNVSITNAGMSVSNRLQIELDGADNTLDPFLYLPSWTPSSYATSATSFGLVLPPGISPGDKLFAAVVARSAITPPAGWTLHTSVDCASAVTALQRLSVFTKDSAAPADSGATATFTQATAGRMGAMAVVVRRDGGSPVIASASTAVVNTTSTNAVTPPVATSTRNGQLALVFATTINAQAVSALPTAPSNFDLITSTPIAEYRLACAYQSLDETQSSRGTITFDNGTPTNNGLAAITFRISPT